MNPSETQLQSLETVDDQKVQTTLNYYLDPGDGTPPIPVVVGSTTVTNERPSIAVDVEVTDISHRESDFTLDIHGFQLVHHVSHTACQSDGYHDLATIKAEYFPECELLLKNITGATRALIFDHKVRRGPADWHALGANNTSQRGPLHRVHVDQSYAGAEFLLDRFLGDEAAALRGRRWQIINLWRPIKTVQKDPLAVCDARSVAEDDLIAARVVYRDHERETWTVKPNAGHRWFYKKEQTPEEVMLIKCFDSDEGVARRTPHSAFRDGGDEEEPRESVEVRAFVFYGAATC